MIYMSAFVEPRINTRFKIEDYAALNHGEDLLDIISEGKYSLDGATRLGSGSYGTVWDLGDGKAVKFQIFDTAKEIQFKEELYYYQRASDVGIGPPILDLIASPVELKGFNVSVGFIIMKKCGPFTKDHAGQPGSWDQLDEKITRLSEVLDMRCYDLKPDNILVDPDTQELYITDYGSKFCMENSFFTQNKREEQLLHTTMMKIVLYLNSSALGYRTFIYGSTTVTLPAYILQMQSEEWVGLMNMYFYNAIDVIYHYSRSDEPINVTENKVIQLFQKILYDTYPNENTVTTTVSRTDIVDTFYGSSFQGTYIDTPTTHVVPTTERVEYRF